MFESLQPGVSLALIPESALEPSRPLDWEGILCHELAHWRRRDHLAAFLAEILLCVLPWNPLAWWAKTRLSQLAELACDDWVLASGSEGTDYAASLLELVPQRGPALALTAVSSRGGLVGRVRHILDERRSSPRIGKGWAFMTGVSMTLAASAIALAQTRPASSAMKEREAQAINTQTPSDSTSKKLDPMKHTIRGRVLGPDGKPASDATVIWVGRRKPSVPYVALPRDDESRRNPTISTLARAQTDAQGGFSLTASFDPDGLIRYNGIESKLVVIAPGAGMFSKDVNPAEDLTDAMLQLPPETVIHGRLLTPAGQPAKGVQVALDGFFNDLEHSGMYYLGMKYPH
jgi:BlaR1 peptidase M56